MGTAVLIDAGPLIALIDRGEPRHDDCVAAVRQVQGPLLTTWPVLTEAMYILGDVGWRAQRLLWELMLSEDVEIADLDGAAIIRARALMEKYQDVPMDLAEASLVAVAEQRRLTRVLTLDGHFHAYRPAPRATFEVLPAPAPAAS